MVLAVFVERAKARWFFEGKSILVSCRTITEADIPDNAINLIPAEKYKGLDEFGCNFADIGGTVVLFTGNAYLMEEGKTVEHFAEIYNYPPTSG